MPTNTIPPQLTPLRFARLSSRLSILRLSNLTGIPVHTLRRADDGKLRIAEKVSPEKLQLLARVLGLGVADLREARLMVLQGAGHAMANAVHQCGEIIDRIDEEREHAEQNAATQFRDTEERDFFLKALAALKALAERKIAEAEELYLTAKHRPTGPAC